VRWAEALVRRADGRLFAAGDARRLAAVRIGLCCVLALRLATTDYGQVAGQPAALFQPVSYMKLFARMPSQEFATAVQIGGILAALVAAAGLALRLSLPSALVCSLLLDGMLDSAGRVIVGDAVLTLCLLVLVACGPAAGEAWSVRRVRLGPAVGVRYGWPVRTAMLTIALAYFFAGFQKWRYSGIAWVTSDNLRWILDGQAHPDGLAAFVAGQPWLAHALAGGALALETCFPLALFVTRLRWLFVPAAIAMHVGIRLTLGLDYSAQWLAAIIVFVNWPVVVAWLKRALAPLPLTREAAR
jgi:hypothetical protein